MNSPQAEEYQPNTSQQTKGPCEPPSWVHTTLSLYRVTDEVDGSIITENGAPFDCHSYSKFKYGHREIASTYADSLTQRLLKSPIAAQFDSEQPVIVSASAYKRLHTAAVTVADGVAARMRWAGFSAQRGRIHRSKLTEGDYGAMDAEQRRYWMANNGLSVDTAVFHGRHVIIVDDVRITGSHEEAIWNLFADMPIKSLSNLYIIELEPELATRDPLIEDRINHTSIKTLNDLYRMMWDEDSYTPTARTVKFVLSRPLDALKQFLERIGGGDLRSIHLGLLDDGYFAMPAYREGTRLVLDEVDSRKRKSEKTVRKNQRLDLDQEVWLNWNPQPYRAPFSDAEESPIHLPQTLKPARRFSLFGYDISVNRKNK